MLARALAYAVVLALFDCLPVAVPADAAFVAQVLDMPEAVAGQLLDDLEAAGCLVSAVGPVQ